MKRVQFLGSSRKDLSSFPEHARKLAGFALQRIQEGRQPKDFKPMTSIGPGVEELRVWSEAGTFRVVYVARFEDLVYVLHAFEKKTQTTSKADIEVARNRYRELIRRQEPR